MAPGDGIERVTVGGTAAVAEDFLLAQNDRMPWAIGTTLVASALILFLLFGSLVIPLKAVVMTLLSLSASFGALVWVFQEGNLHEFLGFEPLGFTIAGNPIIMFATLIGLSMDYEVLLLSRIQESYRRTRDNTAAVAEGLAKTAGVITGAAMIMVVVFSAFALADVVTIKSIGVGMALAVFVDATVDPGAPCAGHDAAPGRMELVGARYPRAVGRQARVQPRGGRDRWMRIDGRVDAGERTGRPRLRLAVGPR